MLHLDHRALARQVSAGLQLCNDTVQARAFEAREPVERNRSIARCGCEVHRGLCSDEQLFEGSTAHRLRRSHERAPGDFQRIEGDERSWCLFCELFNARYRRMQSQLQGVEIEPACRRYYDLAVQHTVLGQSIKQSFVQLREIAIEGSRI